jgi:hypothetical protein
LVLLHVEIPQVAVLSEVERRQAVPAALEFGLEERYCPAT